ncbi:beta-ketoacyl-ACP synthase III [Nocardia sp. ET3-3]|uniref:Beta-ketoacyl-[acyl-carrier-protein] synthase III n=1 Tax=Nocardia terrae TaxID=2675851 RepID=A0A7K1V4F7_9NOCA|nr:beta-ketoacyl-ACP synthase III [Nocardia terrae]MVU81309.1 beta-ketoacyl-ACP synthase III [Nocardia terrae]
MGISIRSVGAYVPSYVETNHDLARQINTSDEWIRSRTGIAQRYIIAPDQSTTDLAYGAARAALEAAGRPDIDLLVVATATPDRSVPATAPRVADRLGISGIPAFDVAAVCSGFVYAMAVTEALMRTLARSRALVVGADAFSRILGPDDRSTRAIFGDGAGAFLLVADPDSEEVLLGRDLGSDGSGHDLITRPSSGSASVIDHLAGLQPYFAMSGKAVFMQSVRAMVQSSENALKDAGRTASDVDLLVPHQANLRIINAVADGLSIPVARAAVNIDRVGNTVAASIPLAVHDALRAGKLRAGQTVLMTAFGGGLTWGSLVLSWPDNVAH